MPRSRCGYPLSVYILLIMTLGLTAAVQAEDGTNGVVESQDDDHAKLRIDYMAKAMGRYEVQIRDAESNQVEIAKLIETPLLRWTNPHSNAKDAAFFAYSRGGRPDVLAQIAIYSPKNTVHEFEPTCLEQLEMLRNDRTIWKPAPLTAEFTDLEDVSAPTGSPVLRLAQMRRLAESFEVYDHHGWNEPVRQPLRLLRQPVHRYSDTTAGIIDGGVFVFALATDPEAFVLLEAYEGTEGPRWRYRFSPMTIYQLEAYRHEELVWDKPDRRAFCNGQETHYVCPYRADPDDSDLQGKMPQAPKTEKPTPTE